ncbi:intradiol ring-cleavage dioxygenase [Sulfitobacter sp. Ks41]|uniref:intradiol ring-cleavage dioxygenase n=2 Tax=Roseobacteraceae TaxID=2854170 RepID=UPI0023E0F838|nr:intradiol ring-cleavage dioxygenase [Sulfitobacter sp. Ks41]MDF3362730.1 intradiol ring-cleavage dioxygenase [Sulfitobacter sp. Ks41]
MSHTPTPTRRNLLRALAAAPVAAPILLPGAAQAQSVPADLSLAAATMGLITTNVCAVTPETTEGPYYIDPKLVRQDITEGKEGIALRLNVQVVTADCRPVAGARVDIWQCDAQGYYSGYPNMGSNADQDTTGQTYLRGTQMADDHGIATFDTIYPGWYRGRTTHIHYKVYLDEKTVLTSQIFLPDALSEYIYLKHPAYTRPEERDTLNGTDGIATQAGEGAYAAIREQKDRYIAALVVGVDPDAEWSEGGQGMGGPMGARPTAGGPPPQGQGGPQGGPRGRDETTRIFPETE